MEAGEMVQERQAVLRETDFFCRQELSPVLAKLIQSCQDVLAQLHGPVGSTVLVSFCNPSDTVAGAFRRDGTSVTDAEIQIRFRERPKVKTAYRVDIALAEPHHLAQLQDAVGHVKRAMQLFLAAREGCENLAGADAIAAQLEAAVGSLVAALASLATAPRTCFPASVNSTSPRPPELLLDVYLRDGALLFQAYLLSITADRPQNPSALCQKRGAVWVEVLELQECKVPLPELVAFATSLADVRGRACRELDHLRVLCATLAFYPPL